METTRGMSLPTSNSSDEGDGPPKTTSFELLHDAVKRWIWNQEEWTALRGIQERAIPVILEGDSDVILSSPTASGKTEAAFLPILSTITTHREMDEASSPGFDVIYISPLKALINDQFERLENLCKICDLPVHRRHGDVSSSKKRKALEDPDGILLITPESVEALFLRQPMVFQQALQNVSYVVVDEVHSFIGEPRGKQLQSLLHRIEQARGAWTPRVALSATIGDLDTCAEFLRPDSESDVEIIESDEGRQELRLVVKGYERRIDTSDNEDGDRTTGTEVDIAEHVLANLRGQDNLVFANRRSDVELYTDLLTRLSEEKSLPNQFYAHHGSLSKEIRENGERALKNENLPATVLCTSTLELGIDIGWMDSIGQIGSPPSVSSLRQRLGRSGRKDDPAILRVYIQEPEITESTSLLDTLRPELVQTIAMVDLLLEPWYEPPNLDALELSTLIQQLISIITQHGGIRADEEYRFLCKTGPFGNISTSQFESLLQGLATEELITQAGDGELIMGLSGERLIRHYDFYSAFSSPDEYRLVADERTIGTLPVTNPLIEDQLLIFGGQRWQVREINEEKKIAYLQAAAGGRVPKFGGEGALVHTRVREKMRFTYNDSEIPRYLDPDGEELLEEGRKNFDRYDLANRDCIPQGEDTVLFLWTGDRIVNTIHVMLVERGLQASKTGMSLQVRDCTPEEFMDELQQIISSGPPQPAKLAEIVENKLLDKHDCYLPEELLCENYASKLLDVDKALSEADRIVAESQI